MTQRNELVIFDAKEQEAGLTHEEIWDDTLLIQQWDSSMAKVRHRLDQRRATTTESEQSDPDPGSTNTKGEGSGSAAAGFATGWRGSAESITKRTSKSKKKKKKSTNKKVEWQVGEFCCARYTEDGLWYEACITSLPPSLNPPRCWVRFLGYNNTQEMAVEGLRRSNGEEARRRQIREAEEEEASESEVGSSVAESDRQSDTDGERTSKRHKPPSHHSNNHPSMPPPPFHGTSSFTAPGDLPVLPPPPALTRDPTSDPQTSQALHTMLMSWYMTGYHTGYYQGLTHAARK